MCERAMSLCHVLLGNAHTNPIAEDVSSQLVCVTKTIQLFIQTALADSHRDQLKVNGKWTDGTYHDFLNAYIHTQTKMPHSNLLWRQPLSCHLSRWYWLIVTIVDTLVRELMESII